MSLSSVPAQFHHCGPQGHHWMKFCSFKVMSRGFGQQQSVQCKLTKLHHNAQSHPPKTSLTTTPLQQHKSLHNMSHYLNIDKIILTQQYNANSYNTQQKPLSINLFFTPAIFSTLKGHYRILLLGADYGTSWLVEQVKIPDC